VDKLIITAAISGAAVLPVQTPYLPITPKQIADEAVRAAEAGAASVHIHARNPENGEPTSDIEVFREILTRIKERSDAVIGISTAGARGLSAEEKIKPVTVFEPELASYDVGSVTRTGERLLEAYKDTDYKFPWEKEALRLRSKDVWANSFDDLHLFGRKMQEVGTKPEYEIFDVGWLYNARFLWRTKAGYSKPPFWVQFVLGGFGTIGSSPEHLLHLRQTLGTLFDGEQYKWSVIGIGYPGQFYVAAQAMIMGGHVRVGIEDNLEIRRGVLTKSNAELVERAVRLARELDREIATPDEARAIIGLKGKDKVKF